jgi:hypothetical protein
VGVARREVRRHRSFLLEFPRTAESKKLRCSKTDVNTFAQKGVADNYSATYKRLTIGPNACKNPGISAPQGFGGQNYACDRPIKSGERRQAPIMAWHIKEAGSIHVHSLLSGTASDALHLILSASFSTGDLFLSSRTSFLLSR